MLKTWNIRNVEHCFWGCYTKNIDKMLRFKEIRVTRDHPLNLGSSKKIFFRVADIVILLIPTVPLSLLSTFALND